VNSIFAEANEDNKNDLILYSAFEIDCRQFKGLDANGLISEDIIDGYFNLLHARNPRFYFFTTQFYTSMTYHLSEGINSPIILRWFKNFQIFI